jgi:cytidylate kinase
MSRLPESAVPKKPTAPAVPIVAIDGPAGSGKSSVAREVAKRLGFTYVTTGALYRTLALVLDELGLSHLDHEAVAAAVRRLSSEFRQSSDTGAVSLAERDVTLAIKAPRMSELASIVAEDPLVRQALLPLQRQLVLACRGAVVDGRDMGTVVFPDAAVKVFLTASAAERAKRRSIELAALGKAMDPTALVAEIEARDLRDTTRQAAPLRPAHDAVVIDSTGVDFEGVVTQILALCRQKVE